MKALETDEGRKGVIIEEELELQEEDMRTKVLKIVNDVTKRANLAEAHVIVAAVKAWVTSRVSS